MEELEFLLKTRIPILPCLPSLAQQYLVSRLVLLQYNTSIKQTLLI